MRMRLPLFSNISAGYVLDKRGTKEVCVSSTGNDKTRVMLMLACMVDGHQAAAIPYINKKVSQKSNFPAPDVHNVQ